MTIHHFEKGDALGVRSGITNDHTPLIREAELADYPEMQQLQIDCIRGLVGTYTLQDMEAWAKRIESREPQYAAYNNLVCVDDTDKLTAFISWSRRSTGYIECLYTLDEYRRRGVGSLLLQLAEANLAGTAIRMRSTVNAQPFYEKRGYQCISYPRKALFRVALMEKPPAGSRS